MDMPEPGADHEKLQKLTGSWAGKETMHPSPWDPKGGEADGNNVGRKALGGFAVIVEYEQRRDGKTTFEGHGVYMWDNDGKEVVLHWFDSMGQGREEFRGTWDGDRLTLTSKNAMGFARLLYDWSKPNEMGSAMEMSQDGESWSKVFDGTYTQSS